MTPRDPFTVVCRCSSCGALRQSADPRWRWNGEEWEHKCGYSQAGHFPARRRFQVTSTNLPQACLDKLKAWEGR